ncbi:monocarboxylate permease-like protein [Lojkania enalia]|uniref:Monocarboxylate permease-like protein n=1 Tax=Lojkania enalia TaxID=147567 RepID=A0A9P4N6E4_9PLEO|nr:monocarboxylate permease-like protein [Didymosphaeria enalia]
MSLTQAEKRISREEEEHPSINFSEVELQRPSESAEFGPPPDGGLQAWLVAAGGACVTFACMGFANAFGVFQEYYFSHQLSDQSPDDIAWIGSLGAFMQFAGGVIGGPLFDRYGAWIMTPAALGYIFAMMMTSLCSKYWQFMLSQGVLLGACMGLTQFPAFAAVSQFFDKKRAVAFGLVISGSSIGGVVLPIALSKMFNSTSLSFGWSVRIIGFVITPLLVFACVVTKARLPPRKTNFFVKAAFKDKKYDLLIVSLLFMFCGMFTPLFFIPTYAVSKGMSVTLASYLLAIVNAASTFGRIIPGVLADKYGRFNILAVGGIATGIVILCLTRADSNAELIVYSIFMGFTSGSVISGGSAAISVCAEDPREAGAYMGQGMAFAAIAALIGPPINGALIKRYEGFLQSSIFSGVVCIVGGCLALLAKSVTPQGILGII